MKSSLNFLKDVSQMKDASAQEIAYCVFSWEVIPARLGVSLAPLFLGEIRVCLLSKSVCDCVDLQRAYIYISLQMVKMSCM